MAIPQQQPDLPPANSSGWFVALSIIVAFILFFAAVSTIAYHWLTTSEPTSILEVDASTALADAQIEVHGMDEPVDYKATIGDGQRYTLPFYLNPGAYSIDVTRNGDKLLHEDIVLRSGQGLRLNLSGPESKSPATKPASP